jgi:chemotaxis protein CheZ
MVEREKVVKLINSVIAKVEHHGDPYRGVLHKELLGLQGIIDRAREELRSTNIGDIHAKHIPTATDELDAIVKSTEGATLEIFSACEAIERVLPGLTDHHRDAIQTEVTRVYEACSFQDITGQRINKVVRSIKDIEGKVGSILQIINERMGDMNLHESVSEDERVGDARLMNGPQLPAEAISQAEIDKLLAEFDN